MRIIFIRHGELEGENSSVLHDVNDPVSLSEKGRSTIIALCSVLKKEEIGLIVSSPEIRTKESAEIISQELSIPTQYLEGLQGRKWGDFAGKTWDEVGKILGNKSTEERYEFVPPSGESWKQFESRMLTALRVISQSHQKNICIVSHGSSVRVLLQKIFAIPVEESLKLYPEYGSMSVVEYDGQNYTNPFFNRQTI
ncbi:MAG: histidine phosphatase family protein [bacterium]|nr:histidine phosphatase family protein [bacterium]